MITYEEKQSSKPGEKAEDIKFYGLTIGEMVTYEGLGNNSFHAIFKSRCRSVGLIQGHGNSREAAIKKAISSAETDAQELMKEAAELKGIFGVPA